MNIVGIDPGLAGAIAVLDQDRIVLVEDLPIHQIPAGRKLRAELDLAALRELLCGLAIDHCVIERVAARPGQGTVSMFRFGYSAGAIAGLVAGLQLPYSFITPQAWQKAAGIGPSPDQARQRAAQLYPGAVPYLMRKKDDGRADAILIARAGLQMLTHPREAA